MPSDPTRGRPTAGGLDGGAPAPRPSGPRAPSSGPGRAVRATRALVAAVLALLVVATVVTALLGHAGGEPEPEGAPAPPPSPAPVTVAGLPPLLPPLDDLAGATAGPAPPTGVGLTAALAPLLADPALGPRVALAVADATTGELLLDLAPPGEPEVIPASTSKILTAAAALTALDPAARLSTRVVAGATADEIVLVGGGDPTLASAQADPATRIGGEPPARLAALADATALELAARAPAAGDGAGPVTVTVDASLFGPAELAPGWKPSYLSSGNVAPVVALSVDAGRVRPGRAPRHAEPDLAAGQAFAVLLAERGVAVAGVARGAAPAGATRLAAAQSPPVAALVEEVLAASDNDLAEALGRHVALALGHPPTAAGAALALREAVAGLGLGVAAEEAAVADASGLSRDSRVSPAAVARLLAAASSPDRPDLRPVVTGLPVAGFSGTLAERYRGPAGAGAAGDARAKTGTLSGVSALAGVVVDAEGRLLAFDVTADAVPSPSPRPAEAALDRLVAALAACGCA